MVKVVVRVQWAIGAYMRTLPRPVPSFDRRRRFYAGSFPSLAQPECIESDMVLQMLHMTIDSNMTDKQEESILRK